MWKVPTSPANDEFETAVFVGGTKKRNAPELSPDNAEKIFMSSFDFKIFHEALGIQSNSEITQEELFFLMKSCIFDPNPEIVSFSNVRSRHLESLGLAQIYELEYDGSLERAANAPNSPGNMYLRQTSLRHIQKHFNLTKESGAQCMIDQFPAAGVIYAQAVLDDDQHQDVKADILKRYRINNPHIAVFTEVPIPYTKVRSGLTSYTFHGFLDYGVGFVPLNVKSGLVDGQVPFDADKTLAGILEAKSMVDGESQITVQVLIILAVTKRKVFTAALTNGAYWRFFTAYDGDTQIRIYASGLFAARDSQGLIVEYLKDMILYPTSPMLITDLAKVPDF